MSSRKKNIAHNAQQSCKTIHRLQQIAMDFLPSDHIRLLCIEPGLDDSPIRCRLLTTSLESSPPNEALSYTWGSLELDSTIACDGIPMFVTTHLHDALQYLRTPEHERIMWIGAVCINQRNDCERAEQVRIMNDIYTKAWYVVIWLGKETPEDKMAFELLDRFKEIFEEEAWLRSALSIIVLLDFQPSTTPTGVTGLQWWSYFNVRGFSASGWYKRQPYVTAVEFQLTSLQSTYITTNEPFGLTERGLLTMVSRWRVKRQLSVGRTRLRGNGYLILLSLFVRAVTSGLIQFTLTPQVLLAPSSSIT